MNSKTYNEVLRLGQLQESTSVVFLDINQVEVKGNILPSLPYYDEFKNDLDVQVVNSGIIVGKDMSAVDSPFISNVDFENPVISDRDVKIIFLRNMLSLFIGYEEYLLPLNVSTDIQNVSIFDYDKFLASLPPSALQIMREVVCNTQLMSDFLFRRTFSDEHEEDILFFDSCLNKIGKAGVEENRYEKASLINLIFFEKEFNMKMRSFEHTVKGPVFEDLNLDENYSYPSWPILNSSLFIYPRPSFLINSPSVARKQKIGIIILV